MIYKAQFRLDDNVSVSQDESIIVDFENNKSIILDISRNPHEEDGNLEITIWSKEPDNSGSYSGGDHLAYADYYEAIFGEFEYEGDTYIIEQSEA